MKPGREAGLFVSHPANRKGAKPLLNKEKGAEEMSRRSHNYASIAKKMKPIGA
jgi:hypothetical protein